MLILMVAPFWQVISKIGNYLNNNYCISIDWTMIFS